jgi:hypothetical protein
MLSDDVLDLADDDLDGSPKADDNSDCDDDDDDDDDDVVVDDDDDGSLEVVAVKADAVDAAVAATTRAVTDVETNFMFMG